MQTHGVVCVSWFSFFFFSFYFRQPCGGSSGTSGAGDVNDRNNAGGTANGPSSGAVSQPKHAHVPHIPVEGELSFALLAFLFSVTSMALQYLHLYKTVWWLPHSHAEYAIVSWRGRALEVLNEKRIASCRDDV